jgi:predicted unusual protein kinase regulating ubiquinone biosynthesis (AarF/ABC1/UbiB family)
LADNRFEDRENILKRFIEFSYGLHQKGVYHIDYSPGNILVKKVNGRYLFSIIDVNRMKFVEFDSTLRMKSLAKLTKESNDNKFIARYYSQISKIDEETLLAKLENAVREEQRYLDNKKRLKRLRS